MDPNISDEWNELEDLRRDASALLDHLAPGGWMHKLVSWCLREIEDEQKEITDSLREKPQFMMPPFDIHKIREALEVSRKRIEYLGAMAPARHDLGNTHYFQVIDDALADLNAQTEADKPAAP